VRHSREVIGVLTDMSPSLVRSGFEALAEERAISQRMRAEFERVLGRLDYGATPPPLKRKNE